MVMLVPLKGSLGGAPHNPWPEAALASSVLYMSFGEKHLKYRLGEIAQVLGCSVGLPSGGAEQEGSVGSDSSQGPPKVLIQWLWPV